MATEKRRRIVHKGGQCLARCRHSRPRPVPRRSCTCTGALATEIDAPFLIQDHLFVELSNREALVEEGLSMQHCVSTYPCRCAKGTRVFSIRNLENQRLATLALTSRLIGNSKADEDIRYIVEQVRGPTNSDPTPQAWSSRVFNARPSTAGIHLTRQAILQECRRFSEIERVMNLQWFAWLCRRGAMASQLFLPLWQACSKYLIHVSPVIDECGHRSRTSATA